MNELLQTADHYRKHPDKLEKLTDTELETLKNTLGDLFCAVHAPLKKANFATYKKEVIRLTANNLQILPQFRAKSVLDAQMYVIDHKIPAILGYKKGLKAELIASSGNLQIITLQENAIKGVRPLVDAENAEIWEKIS